MDIHQSDAVRFRDAYPQWISDHVDDGDAAEVYVTDDESPQYSRTDANAGIAAASAARLLAGFRFTANPQAAATPGPTASGANAPTPRAMCKDSQGHLYPAPSRYGRRTQNAWNSPSPKPLDLSGPTPTEQFGTQESSVTPTSQTSLSQLTDSDITTRMNKLIEESKSAQDKSLEKHSEDISKVKSEIKSLSTFMELQEKHNESFRTQLLETNKELASLTAMLSEVHAKLHPSSPTRKKPFTGPIPRVDPMDDAGGL